MDQERSSSPSVLVTGIGLAVIGLFCLLSLYSHTPSDVMDFVAKTSGESQASNLGGWFGARIAHHLFSLYGLGAWVLCVSLLVFGAQIASEKSFQGIFWRSLGAILLTALVSTWAGIFTLKTNTATSMFSNYPAGSGGLLGAAYLAPVMSSTFGEWGAHLVLFGVGVLAAMMIAQELTEYVIVTAFKALKKAMHWGVESATQRLAQAPAKASARWMPTLAPAGAGGGAVPVPASVSGRRVIPEVEEKDAPPTRKLPGLNIPAGKKNEEKPADEKKSKAAKEEEKNLNALIVEPEVEKPLDEEIEKPKGKRSKKEAKEEAAPVIGDMAAVTPAEPEVKETAAEREMRLRKEEALRQAEAAEQRRLAREKEAAEKEVLERAAREQKEKEERETKERQEREAKALEKLQKERAGKDAAKEKAREKLKATLSGKEAPADEGEQSGAGEADAEEVDPLFKKADEYRLPDWNPLEGKDESYQVSSEALVERGQKLIETLMQFKIGARLVDMHHGPAVTMYELALDPGIKISRVNGLSDNLAMAMKSEHGVRVMLLPGKDTIGIEIPNTENYVVRMRPIMESPSFRSEERYLPLVLGRDSTGNPLIADLAKMPHLLIAGTTGSGKSVCVNSIILSIMLLKKPHECKLILVDPKQVEMTDFKHIPHLLTPVVTDMKLAAGVLTWAVQKMEERYEKMSKVGVRNIATYNKLTREERLSRLPQGEIQQPYMDNMPYIVIIVDEFADLMMTAGKEIEQAIARLAAKARAAGVHVILATQRPSADVVTGLIKTNLPCRICFQVKQKLDSRIILDTGGGEKLAGKGDMLYVPPGTSNLVRAKGVCVGDHEIKHVVEHCKGQAQPTYTDEIEKHLMGPEEGDEEGGDPAQQLPLDEKFDEAVECFISLGRASTSLLQRRMSLGYTRAAKICDQMERLGIVGPDRGAKGRELLISQDGWDTYKSNRDAPSDNTWGKLGSKDNPGPKAAAVEVSVPELDDDGAESDEVKPANIDVLDDAEKPEVAATAAETKPEDA